MVLFLYLLQFLAFVSSAVLFYNYYYKRRNLPPGPAPLPIFGNLLEIARKQPGEDAFIDWRKQYGDVYTYWFGELPVVAVTNYKTIIETFQKDGDAYAGRKTDFNPFSDGGVVDTDGELWLEHRRFTLHLLRELGLGKDLMQQRVLDEVASLIAKIDKDMASGLKEHDVASAIDISVGSVINTLLFGHRFDEEHEAEFFELKRLISEDFAMFGDWKWRVISNNPKLYSRLPVFKAFCEHVKAGRKRLDDYYQRQIDEHAKLIDFETDAPPTDYAEAYLREKRKRDAENGPHGFTMTQMKAVCHDLFIAGQETSSTTLAWGVAYLIHSPDAQRRLHEELDKVIGSDRLVVLADRAQLPYTTAVINEIQRLCNLVPQNLPHKTTREVVVDGYRMPKGTIIVPQICAILYDEEIFPDPKVFKPERFLDDNGHLKHVEQLIPFSVGKRQCLGEGLARMELFLFVANVFNQYKISSGTTLPSLKRTIAATVPCPPYTCIVEKRH